MENFDIVFHREFAKIRHIPSGELMHSIGKSEEEVELIYIQGSKLREKLLLANHAPLVLWDVGLGAALNASAALAAIPGSNARRLRVISFEIDLTPARLVCEQPLLFPSIDTKCLSELLENKRVITEKFDWILIEGDFAKTFQDSLKFGIPEICFFDPFSPKTDVEMWDFNLFKRIEEVVADRAFELFTYSQSTAIRAGLLAAGFFVAEGAALPPKESSTAACTRSVWFEDDGKDRFLGERWLERWRRSSNRNPFGVQEKQLFSQAIEQHPQFC